VQSLLLKERIEMGVMMRCGCAANSVCRSSRGTVFDPPVPSCAIHECIEVAETPVLQGRMARCAYGDHADKPSSLDLPFFEYRGGGSPDARQTCKNCRYFESAHAQPRPPHLRKFVCETFTPHGAYDFDRYCGCRGWD